MRRWSAKQDFMSLDIARRSLLEIEKSTSAPKQINFEKFPSNNYWYNVIDFEAKIYQIYTYKRAPVITCSLKWIWQRRLDASLELCNGSRCNKPSNQTWVMFIYFCFMHTARFHSDLMVKWYVGWCKVLRQYVWFPWQPICTCKSIDSPWPAVMQNV